MLYSYLLNVTKEAANFFITGIASYFSPSTRPSYCFRVSPTLNILTVQIMAFLTCSHNLVPCDSHSCSQVIPKIGIRVCQYNANSHVYVWKVRAKHFYCQFSPCANKSCPHPRWRRGKNDAPVWDCILHALLMSPFFIKVAFLEGYQVEADGKENFMYRHPILDQDNWG